MINTGSNCFKYVENKLRVATYNNTQDFNVKHNPSPCLINDTPSEKHCCFCWCWRI